MDGRRFPLWPFFVVCALGALSAGALNWAIDPLWFAGGNKLTGRNFIFNERLAKTNLFLSLEDRSSYDCLILGSSRAIALRPSRLQPLRCFSFAMKAAEVPEFLAYAKFARAQGLTPSTVVFTVDEFNFVRHRETAWRKAPTVAPSPSAFHAYFSLDVLTFSGMTLFGVSPDRDMYYDDRFEMQEFPGHGVYEPRVVPSGPQECDLGRIQRYDELLEIFPQARWIGYVPPKATWLNVGDTYLAGVLDCELEGIHRVAQKVAALQDFTIPSALTADPSATYDGSHFRPVANDQVALALQGGRTDLSLRVKDLSLDDYRREHRERLRAFLESHDLMRYWAPP